VHALALIAVALLSASGGRIGTWAQRSLAVSGWCFLAGVLLFPGSLYVLAAGAPPAWGSLAPMGGTLLIIGWLALLLFAVSPRPAD
jgi:uncharacterized membrane protein YgdD (TMEM256/DUF423 family)